MIERGEHVSTSFSRPARSRIVLAAVEHPGNRRHHGSHAPEPGAVQILPPGESVGRPLPPLGVPLAERRPTFGYSAAATVPINNDELLPEGVYRTPEVTHDQQIATAVNAGFAEEDVNAFLGAGDPADTYVIGLRLADGGWTQLVSYNGGAEEVGWRGTYEVIDEDTVVATDPCGSITYTYAFDGEQLTLDMIDDQCDGVEEQIAQTIIFETAPFTLVEAGQRRRHPRRTGDVHEHVVRRPVRGHAARLGCTRTSGHRGELRHLGRH